MKEAFFQFVHPEALLIFLLLPLLLFCKSRFKLKSGLEISSNALFSNIPVTLKQRLLFLQPLLWFLGMSCLILALARPQSGLKYTESISEGVDIILSLDTSGSMRALDFLKDNQEVNRLEVIKDVVSEFIRKRKFDRIGLVVFGEEAFTQCPLTTDYSILNNLVSRLKIGMAGDGTAIGDGLALAVKRLSAQKTKSKIIILLTDGRSNAGSLSPEIAADLAKELGVRVYTIGVGTSGLVPYPEETPFGVRKVYAQLDLDEPTLKQIAATTGGKYFRAKDTAELSQIYGIIDSLEKTEMKTMEHKEVNDYFMTLMSIGLICFVVRKLASELYFFWVP